LSPGGGAPPNRVDAQGKIHPRAGAEVRIACLVPSITELVCDLGLADRLVARTGFCIHPREVLAKVPKVGGTKDVDLERLRALAPTHVIVNIDENEKPVAESIARFVPHVIVTHPKGPGDNADLYRLLGGIFRREAEAEQLCGRLQDALEAAGRDCAGLPRERVLYLIWKDPWMTVSRDTYIARTLAVVGWDTLPEVAAFRYPEVVLDEAARHVDRVLLSTEPYRFGGRHLAELARALAPVPVQLVDGEMTSWYGPRAITGLGYLARMRLATAG
jgi:ABC-type Fe3+-hydroxamate transport system substrate-binding protein